MEPPNVKLCHDDISCKNEFDFQIQSELSLFECMLISFQCMLNSYKFKHHNIIISAGMNDHNIASENVKKVENILWHPQISLVV